MTDEHTANFLKRLRNRYSIDSESMTNSDWLEQNTTLRKKPFTLSRHEFQRAIADDMHENMSVIKPSQVGLTEIQIRKVLAWARRNDGVSVIYTMPNDEMRGRVSQTRVKPIIENDTVFNTEFDEEAVRSKGLLQFGQSFIYLTGSKEGDATSIPADFVANDEVDLTDEEMLGLFRSRLQGSRYKINQKFSTPTFPKKGISKDYAGSDQHEYMIKCPSCNHEQVPLFTREFCSIPGLGDKHESLVEQIDIENVGDLDLRASRVVCSKCSTPLDLGDTPSRRWIALRPELSDVARGYRIRPFSTSDLDIRYIVKELIEHKKQSSLRRFYNTVLGEPYIDDSIALSDEMVKSQMSRPYGWQYENQPCFIGIDMGMNCHVTLGTFNNADGWNVFLWDIVPATKIVDYVEELMTNYRIVGGAIDRHPYTPTAIDVRSVSRGRIVPAEYRGPTEVNVKENELISEETYAQINRTAALDDVAKAIRSKRMNLVNYGDKESLIIKHLTDMVRVEEVGEKAVWTKQTGEDHFFHALAFMIAGKKLADFIIHNSDDDVRTMVFASAIDTKKRPNDNLNKNYISRKPNGIKQRIGRLAS